MSLFSPKVERATDISVAALAYLGDAVYELHVRLHYLHPPKRNNDYHQLVTAKVRAESQAKQLASITLTEIEADLVRRGRNAAGSPSRNLAPDIYQKATGFETLIGYLYLTDPERLNQILAQLDREDNEI